MWDFQVVFVGLPVMPSAKPVFLYAKKQQHKTGRQVSEPNVGFSGCFHGSAGHALGETGIFIRSVWLSASRPSPHLWYAGRFSSGSFRHLSLDACYFPFQKEAITRRYPVWLIECPGMGSDFLHMPPSSFIYGKSTGQSLSSGCFLVQGETSVIQILS